MRRLPAPADPAPEDAVAWWRRPLAAAVGLTLGSGLLLQGLPLDDPVRLAVVAGAAGLAVLLGGVVLTGAVVVTSAVPSWIAVLGWAVAGLGMGVAFNASTTATLQPVPAARQGQASAALQLAQTLSTALVAGLGGAAVASAEHTSLSLRGALLLVFGFTAVLALGGFLLSRRPTPR